jgi:hypothetical protein
MNCPLLCRKPVSAIMIHRMLFRQITEVLLQNAIIINNTNYQLLLKDIRTLSSKVESFYSIKHSIMSSEPSHASSTTVVPLHPSTHDTNRQEIIYYIQLFITALLRQTFLREELDCAEHAHMQRMLNNSTDAEFIPDMRQITKVVNRRLKAHRRFVKRQSYFFENILYKRATTMEEYYNVEDLEDRLDEVGRILNARLTRAQDNPGSV